MWYAHGKFSMVCSMRRVIGDSREIGVDGVWGVRDERWRARDKGFVKLFGTKENPQQPSVKLR